MLSYHSALQEIVSRKIHCGEETVELEMSRGRYLAKDISADRDYPPFNRAAMDGFALAWAEFQKNPGAIYSIAAELHAGGAVDSSLHQPTTGSCIKIMTGAAVPPSYDAIIPREYATALPDQKVSFEISGLSQWQNIARQGEDVQKDGILLCAGTLMQLPEIAAAASAGRLHIQVVRMPSVAVLRTGNEVVPAHTLPGDAEIRDTNGFSIRCFLQNYGIRPVYDELVADDRELLKQSLKEALKADVLITTGGVSAGDADYLPGLLDEMGGDCVFHKVAIKPGKPLWFGTVGKTTVFGLPGNPLSVQVGLNIFIGPFLRASAGAAAGPELTMTLDTGRKKKFKFDEFVPCIKTSGGNIVPQPFNGSGDIRAGAGGFGFFMHPEAHEVLAPGHRVTVWPWH